MRNLTLNPEADIWQNLKQVCVCLTERVCFDVDVGFDASKTTADFRDGIYFKFKKNMSRDTPKL